MQVSKISRKFIIIILAVSVVLLSFNIGFSVKRQYSAILDKLSDKASILAKQMDAAWYFVEVNQDLINTTEKGEYEFKGLHCAIVGKSIGAIFSKQNDLVKTHYTNLKTRNIVDSPDAFETKALREFQKDSSLTEFYDVQTEDGEDVFRYMSKMTVKESCLECHGEPAGQLDKTGYPKEGWKVGDMAGAISMTLNMEADLAAYHKDLTTDILWAFFFTFLVCGTVLFVMQSFVAHPLKRLEGGVQRMTAGERFVQVDEKLLHDEFLEVGRKFNEMSLELALVYDSLEEQVVARTEELKNANEKLSEANELLQRDNEMKTDFLSIMSHELRTPLTAILTFTALLKKAVDKEEDVKRLDEIEMNGERLLDMINNTLELARLEAGHINLNPELIDISDVIGYTEASILPLAEKKHIDFRILIDSAIPLFYADWEKLCRMIENLCSNAVKFTEEGGTVELSVVKTGEKTMEVRVKDNGVGIEESKQKLIFERFVQSDSSASRRYNGSGLGLSLVKQLAELHGGQVFVESKLGEGSLFTIQLPLRTEELE